MSLNSIILTRNKVCVRCSADSYRWKQFYNGKAQKYNSSSFMKVQHCEQVHVFSLHLQLLFVCSFKYMDKNKTNKNDMGTHVMLSHAHDM